MEAGNTEGKQNECEWHKARKALTSVLGFVCDVGLAKTLAETMHPEVLAAAEKVGQKERFENVQVSDLVSSQRLPSTTVAQYLHELCESSAEKDRVVIEQRLCAEDPSSLAAIAAELGISRQRVFQIQTRLMARIKSRVGKNLYVLAQLLGSRLPPLLTSEELNAHISRVFPREDSLAGRLARNLFRRELRYSRVKDMLLNRDARQAVKALRDHARNCVDDVGLIDEARLKSRLPAEHWRVYWTPLLDCAGFHVVNGFRCIRNSAKARVKSAVLNIGKPATKERIGAECRLDYRRVSGALSNISSVVRADKTRWGLREWIDDEYDGIVGEILQRINENDGCASMTLLLQEIPEKFGVSEASVRAYLATPQFCVSGDDVTVSSVPIFTLRRLEEIIDGLDEADQPFWNFTFDMSYLAGYSLIGVPHEIARELGCAPGESIRVPIAEPQGCRDLSVSWRLASTTKCSIGYLAEPLRKLDVKSNEQVSLVIKNGGKVELRVCENVPHHKSANQVLERMKHRYRVL